MLLNLSGMQIVGIMIIALVIINILIYVIVRTIVTIWQPYFYKKQSNDWNSIYQEYLRKGIYIDYPPRVGRLFGIPPWGYKSEK